MRSIGTARTFVGNAMGGLRGGSNLASWVVAGSLAYYLWVKPARELKKEQEVNKKYIKTRSLSCGLFSIRPGQVVVNFVWSG